MIPKKMSAKQREITKYMSDEEKKEHFARVHAEAREARRQSRTPRGIEWTNHKKLSGNMNFELTTDGKKFVLAMTTNNPAARLLLETLQKLSKTTLPVRRFTVGNSGKQLIEVDVSCFYDTAKLLALAGCQPIPEKCAKCDGYGAFNHNGSPDRFAHVTISGGGKLCPICRGSGRALSDPTEETEPTDD
jgi:hypothetical protein